MTGTVKSWNDSKGYGFITTESGKEVFVHYSEIQGPGFKTLMENQKVEFDLYEITKGLVAKNVRKEVQ